jgi:uncharacterized membrane protein YbhN (UPF0104 family)
MRKTLLQSLLIYAIAAAIVYWVARGVSWRHVLNSMSRAEMWLLATSSFCTFVCWFLGETLLFSRLFSYFHERTHFRELLPTVAGVYFLQVVNSIIASGAFALYLRTRKRVPWITAGCTLMFQAYVDTMLLAILSLIAIALVPSSPIRPGLYYAAGALGGFCIVTALWLFWEPRNRVGRWLYDLPAMLSFRRARPRHYIKLMAIRLGIYIGAGFAMYGQLHSFHIQVPLVQVLALTPFVMAVGNAPISPAGIGTTQLVFTIGFAQFAPRDQLLAASLAATAFNFVFRIPMGFVTGRSLFEEVRLATNEARHRQRSSQTITSE